MENNDLGRALFMDSVKAAEEDGAIPEEDYAVAVDATFIDAPSSTKNNLNFRVAMTLDSPGGLFSS